VGFTLTSTYTFHLRNFENSASTETVMQLYMQDILCFLHTYPTSEHLHHSGKVPFFIVWLQS